MAKVLVPLRPYFERVESHYEADAAAWENALAVVAMELARRPEPERGAGPCRDGSSSDSSRSR